jgi:ABC-2 type transport system permease protein
MRANGWKQVFKFTYLQMIKSKAYITSTIVIAVCILLMSVGINFLPGLFAGSLSELFGSGTDEVKFNINTLYISDRSGIEPAPDFNYFTEFKIEVITITPDEVESITEQVRASLEPVALIEITREAHAFNLLASRPESEAVIGADDCRRVMNYISGTVWASHITSIGVSEDNLGEVTVGINSQVTVAGETPKSEIAAIIANTMLPVVSAIILFLFIVMYGQFVAQAVATEKTSRVMETLLTSVRPMAIILGKVLGMGLASFTQFAALLLTGFGISAVIAPLGMLGQVFGSVDIPLDNPEMQMVQSAFEEAFANFNAMSVVWIIIIFLLGFIFYSLIAGLFGASINRMEDLQAALQPMALIATLGFIIGYLSPIFNLEGVANDEINIVQRISHYLPISSPFALPAAVISGEMSTLGILISVLVLAVFCVLMLMFVSRVYETIITHTGNRIKIGAMFKMAKK